MEYGKVIELFLPEGTAEKLVIAELSNWNAKAIKIPRIDLADCVREDIQGPGVYFLFCKGEEGERDAVYIGESERLKERLMQHIRDYNDEKSKKEPYYWNVAVMFTGTGLNKALIRYLEDLLVQAAKEANRYTLLTKTTYGKTVLKESEQAVMKEFFDNIKILINALGYKVLEPIDSSVNHEEGLLTLEMGDVCAKGYVTTEGFLLLKGAKINEKMSVKSLSVKSAEARAKILKSDKVKDCVTSEDLLFSSSSAAAVFVLGYSASGPKNWKNKHGVALKDLEI